VDVARRTVGSPWARASTTGAVSAASADTGARVAARGGALGLAVDGTRRLGPATHPSYRPGDDRW
jgi:hypothetical protein